jgi:archaeal flagellar protein FlaJ
MIMASGTPESMAAVKRSANAMALLEQLKAPLLPAFTYFESYIESNRIDMDIIYMVTYMNSIATANISRDEIFKRVSEREEFVCSKYMKQVYLLAKNWNYEYSVACNVIAGRVANRRLKDLLLRLSNAMAAGEPEKKFLENEWLTMMVIYKNEYERSLESLKKWTDAYTALLVSMSFISITVVLSIVLYNMGDPVTTLIATATMIALVGGIGVFILRSEAPKEVKVHSMAFCSDEQQLIKKLTKLLLPIAVIVASAMFLFGIDQGYILIAIGLTVFPIGWIGQKDDKKVDNRDKDFSQFTKILGSVVGSMGLTVKEGITKVDRKSIGTLEPMVKKLYTQLIMGIEPRLCWSRFVGGTGSDLINKFTHIFIDAIDMGGDATIIGKLVNTTNLEIVLLRMKRKLISSSFTTLILPMHICMTGLVVFVVEILVIFAELISNLYKSLDYDVSGDIGGNGGVSAGSMGFSLFQNVPTGLLLEYCVFLVIILTVANTMAARYVDGGGSYKFFYYGAIMSVMSGISLLVVPMMVRAIFDFPILQAVA